MMAFINDFVKRPRFMQMALINMPKTTNDDILFAVILNYQGIKVI